MKYNRYMFGNFKVVTSNVVYKHIMTKSNKKRDTFIELLIEPVA